jgi:hypothetical protein
VRVKHLKDTLEGVPPYGEHVPPYGEHVDTRGEEEEDGVPIFEDCDDSDDESVVVLGV